MWGVSRTKCDQARLKATLTSHRGWRPLCVEKCFFPHPTVTSAKNMHDLNAFRDVLFESLGIEGRKPLVYQTE